MESDTREEKSMGEDRKGKDGRTEEEKEKRREGAARPDLHPLFIQ